MSDEKEKCSSAVKIDDLCERRSLFGSELKSLRSGRGLTIAEVAEKTRINPEFIEALESGKFEILPGRVFGRGFVSALMKHYSAVSIALVTAYDQLWTDDGIQNAISDSTKERLHEKSSESRFGRMTKGSRFRPVHIVITAIIFLVLAGGVLVGYKKGRHYFSRVMNKQAEITVVPVHLESKSDPESSSLSVLPSDQPATEEAVPAAGLPDQAVESSKVEEATPEAKKISAAGMPGKQVLTITVIDPVKVKIESDKGKPEIKDFAAGVYSFNFESTADLLIYDAAAVRISFNGNPLGPLGTKGRVRRIGFRSDGPVQKSF